MGQSISTELNQNENVKVEYVCGVCGHRWSLRVPVFNLMKRLAREEKRQRNPSRGDIYGGSAHRVCKTRTPTTVMK